MDAAQQAKNMEIAGLKNISAEELAPLLRSARIPEIENVIKLKLRIKFLQQQVDLSANFQRQVDQDRELWDYCQEKGPYWVEKNIFTVKCNRCKNDFVDDGFGGKVWDAQKSYNDFTSLWAPCECNRKRRFLRTYVPKEQDPFNQSDRLKALLFKEKAAEAAEEMKKIHSELGELFMEIGERAAKREEANRVEEEKARVQIEKAKVAEINREKVLAERAAQAAKNKAKMEQRRRK